MNITINIVEASSELAHKKLIDLNFLGNFVHNIYNGDVYSDEAQKTFDNFYDEYYELLFELHVI